jgi:hypothetical protein
MAGLAPADFNRPVGVGEVAAMNVKNPNLAPLIPKDVLDLSKKLMEQRAQKRTGAVILKEMAADKGDQKKYNLNSPQQDIVRFGGDAGKIGANGRIEAKTGITKPQKERLEQGEKAVKDVSTVMFYMDILKIPVAGNPNARQDEIARLNKINPSFKALNIKNMGDLENRAANVMLADEAIKGLIDNMPDADKYQEDDKIELIVASMLADPQFRDAVSANFQDIHERLLQLPEASQEGVAKTTADKNAATKTLSDKSTDISERLKRIVVAGLPNIQNLSPAEIEGLMKISNNEKEFRRNLAFKFGADKVDDVSQFVELDQEIARLNKQLVDGQLNDTIKEEITKVIDNTDPHAIKETTSKTPTRLDGTQRVAINKRIAGLIQERDDKKAAVGADFDRQLAIVKSVATFADAADVRTSITEGIRASFDEGRLQTQMGVVAGGEISASLNLRLDAEDALIAEMKAMLGSTLGEVWGKKLAEGNALKDEIMEKMIADANTEAEKKLLRNIKTNLVEYDVAKRETTIHGDNIMLASKLMAMEDRGMMLQMALDMEFTDITRGEVMKIFAITADNTETAGHKQQVEVDKLLGKLQTNHPEQYAALEKALADHGSEYRQKIYSSYLEMDEYCKDSGYFLGQWSKNLSKKIFNVGRNVKYEGSPRRLMERITGKGDTTLNVDELRALELYCKADIEAATQSNKDANNFIKKMQEKGFVGNPDLLKKLAWWLFVILGMGSGLGIAALPAAGGLTAATGLAGMGIGGKVGSMIGNRAQETAFVQ